MKTTSPLCKLSLVLSSLYFSSEMSLDRRISYLSIQRGAEGELSKACAKMISPGGVASMTWYSDLRSMKLQWGTTKALTRAA